MASNKKIAAGILAAATLISTPAVGMIAAGTAMADPTTAATITVNGNVSGHHFTAYKLASFGNVTITGGKAQASVASETAVKAKIAQAAQTAGITVASGQDPADAAARANSAQIQAFANALVKAGLTQTAAADGNGSAATLNVTEGWYLVTDSKGLPILVGTQIKSGDQTATAMKDGTTLGVVNVKNTSVSVDKKVNGKDNDSVSVGSHVTYTVDVTLPAKSNVSSYTFSDRLTGGAYDGAVTAKVGSNAATVTPKFDQANGSFTIDLTGLLGDSEQTLTLSYGARTTAKTATNNAQATGKDRNGADLTPGKDTATVKAYDFGLTKVDALSTGTKLQGAQFKIQKKNGAWLKQTGGAWEDAKGEDDATVFTTDAQGRTNFTGLGDGTYTVKETAAPADHYIAGTFTFDATVKDGTTTFSDNNLVSGTNTATVKNNPTVNGLAKTGEGGLLLAGSAAAAMAAIGLGCALAYKRQQAQA